MPPFVAGSREQRQAFARVRNSEREVAFRQDRLGGLNLSVDVDFVAAIEDLERQMENVVQNIVPRVSRALAEDLRGGKSEWPVRTGYSRSQFVGTRRGIENVASYAVDVEDRGRPARRYVDENLGEVVDEIDRNQSLLTETGQ